ncbi:hypothetical protein ACFWIJ_11705 [Streptomyces sp. NPDC127079]|uniref:hypothetical protein n=1 Tax=Streptomyces sp. NPDC127079 TaxID=3347132 RepID=UPI003650AA6C
MHLTGRLLTTAAAVSAVIAAGLSTVPPAAAAASASCPSVWKAVRKVAVRRPAWNEGPVATTRSPVMRYLRRGERVTTCTVAVGRGGWPDYRECGCGSLWREAPRGQVPARCLEPT